MIVVTVDGKYEQSVQVTATDKLQIKSVSYSVIKNSKQPEQLEKTILHPGKINSNVTASDDLFIHLSVAASFKQSSAKPS